MNNDYVNRALMAYDFAEAKEQLDEIVRQFTPEAEIDETISEFGSRIYTVI